MNLHSFVAASLTVLALTTPAPVPAAEDTGAPVIDKNDPQTVLATQGEAVLTQQAIDAAFSRIPDVHRLLFIRDGAKVDQLVRSLLQAKLVAADARANGFAEDPLVQERLRQAVDKELAEAWIAEIARQAPEADFEALAREDYLAHPEEYSTEVRLDVSHILIGTKERTPAEAKEIVERIKLELIDDPSRFDELVREYSDDPAKKSNRGRYMRMRKGQMVKTFERAAFALEAPGEISDPVETEYGYHLIRLDARHESELRPWEQVREEAIERARQKHMEGYRNRYLQKLLMDPIRFPEGSVEVMARRHFGENLEKAPQFKED